MEKPIRSASGIERTAKDGVPIFDGTPELLPYYREEAMTYLFTFETHKRYLAGPRLAKELQGVARTIVRKRNLQDPQWLAKPRGVYALLEYLEKAIERPSLVQASQLISRFFFQMKRKRQESMTQWINRHSEALWEASRALKRVQKDYGKNANPKELGRRASLTGRQSTGPEPEQESDTGSRRDDHDVFDEFGRLPEDEDSERPSLHEWDDRSWRGDHLWSQGWATWWDQRWWQDEYAPPTTWHMEEDDFLPDFLVGFLLLHRSGLDAHERANILAAIRGEFSVAAVSKALREQWNDEDLSRRDRRKEQAMFSNVGDSPSDEGEIMEASEEAPDPDADPEAYAAYQDEQAVIDHALEAIAHQKRTLKDARWRQHQVKLNRKFYPVKGKGKGEKGDKGASSSRTIKCLKCGGPHGTNQCPKRTDDARLAEESAEIAFMGYEESWSVEAAYVTHQEALRRGMGIIDSGATASLASVDAVEAIMEANAQVYGHDRVEVKPDMRPTFRFGNGQKKECLSTIQLKVDLEDRPGKMELHVHDAPGQPALISIKALKNLGAVLDFGTGQCILTKVNRKAVIQLEEASNGHLLFPLVTNVFEKSRLRAKPFLGLYDE